MPVLVHATATHVIRDSATSVKLKLDGSSFIVASSWHPRRHARHPRKDATRMSRVSGDFPVQLATRLRDWSTGGLPRCTVLSACPCVVSFYKFHESDTHDLLQPSSRGCPQMLRGNCFRGMSALLGDNTLVYPQHTLQCFT